MGWLAFAVVLLGTIYFAIHYPGFRRGLRYVGLGLAGIVAVGAVIAWLYSEAENRRMRIARTLIKPSQIEISQATLSLGPYAELKAVVTNKSPHTLRELSLRVTVTDCPPSLAGASAINCRIVGDYVARAHSMHVPSGQKRAINPYVSFANLPPLRPNEWSWHYSVIDVVAGTD